MAQTKKKSRRTKHRGNAVGMIESRGRTGRPTEGSGGKTDAKGRREARANKPPSWQNAINRAVISAILFLIIVILLFKQSIGVAVIMGAVVMILYIPLGYYTDSYAYRRRLARLAAKKD